MPTRKLVHFSYYAFADIKDLKMIKYIYPVSGKIYAYLFGREFFNAFNNFLHYLSLRGLGYLNYKNKAISGENSFAKNYISSLYAL